jgi:DNA repair protein REV1
MGYADELQAVSVDEALIDVTSAVRARETAPEEHIEDGESTDKVAKPRDVAVELANMIRDDVRKLTNCEGMSPHVFCLRSLLNPSIYRCSP